MSGLGRIGAVGLASAVLAALGGLGSSAPASGCPTRQPSRGSPPNSSGASTRALTRSARSPTRWRRARRHSWGAPRPRGLDAAVRRGRPLIAARKLNGEPASLSTMRRARPWRGPAGSRSLKGTSRRPVSLTVVSAPSGRCCCVSSRSSTATGARRRAWPHRRSSRPSDQTRRSRSR